MISESATEKLEGVDERLLEKVSNLTHQTTLFHKRIIEDFGGHGGLRDASALNSAISAPFVTYSGEDLNPTIFDKAACLWRSLSQNHPFIDGNKRVSFGMATVFLFEQGLGIKDEVTDDEIVELCMDIAEGRKSHTEIFQWIGNNTDRASARSFREVMKTLHYVE